MCRAVALLAPARHTELSGCSAPAPPKIFLPFTDGAEYLMVTDLPPIVADGLIRRTGLAKRGARYDGNRQMPANAYFAIQFEYFCESILPLALHPLSGAC